PQQALTHPSHSADAGASYERLEFLGDAVLGLVVADYLFRACPQRDEGRLTRMKSSVVRDSTLATVAERLSLHRYVKTDPGMGGSQELPLSVLSNVFEALVGALYLDAGLDATRQILLRLLEDPLDDAMHDRGPVDHKSWLQEWCHENLGTAPRYELLEEVGPPHQKRFHAAVIVGGKTQATAWGASKREAEQGAAAGGLRSLDAPARRPGPEHECRPPDHVPPNGEDT
ncbi:MAG: ribonuclease III, partial [Pirellulales bacterium]